MSQGKRVLSSCFSGNPGLHIVDAINALIFTSLLLISINLE